MLIIPIIIFLLIIYFATNTIFAFQYINYLEKRRGQLDTIDLIIGFWTMFLFGIFFWIYAKWLD